MSGDWQNILAAYEQAEADEGFSSDVLPRGKYPVRVAKVQEKGTSREKGTPYVRLDLEVIDGPYKGRHAFVTVWLLDVFGAAQELQDRTSKAFKNMQRCKGILRALGFERPGDASGEYASTGEASLDFWRVGQWEGRRFLAGISVETAERQEQAARERGFELAGARDRNQLTSWKLLDEGTYAEWKQKELPKQVKAAQDGTRVDRTQETATRANI